jgi:uncharacterized protein (TIGR00255 family)
MLSMSGFGSAQAGVGPSTVEVEVRAVNNRFLKCQLKLSRNLARYESELEALVRELVARGTVTLTVLFRDARTEGAGAIDAALAARFHRDAISLAQALGLEPKMSLDALLALPGVVSAGDEDAAVDEAAVSAVKAAVRAAVEDMKAMRRREGGILKQELVTIVARIEEFARRIEKRAPEIVAEYQTKLRKRLQTLLADAADRVVVSDDLVLRECAVFADRSDVAEEVQRLFSHCRQFRVIADSEDQAGRRLDFLIQEMLREANTVASKSSDVQVAQWVVDAKVDIERLREQAQNVE